jgi:hypothetical protein
MTELQVFYSFIIGASIMGVTLISFSRVEKRELPLKILAQVLFLVAFCLCLLFW